MNFLGQGSFGDVEKVEGVDGPLALKVIRNFTDRSFEEAKVLKQLKHPHVVKYEMCYRKDKKMNNQNISENILEIKNIEVVYDDVILAISDVSLNVPKGSIVALLGGNGAGKSTTLKSVSTMLASERGKVTKGSITYNGQQIEKFKNSKKAKINPFQNQSFRSRGRLVRRASPEVDRFTIEVG